MKIISKSITLELHETLETGTAKIMCDKPYRIERVEKDNTIVWYGYNTNWLFDYENWYKLDGNKFIKCDIPEYEKLFQELNIKKNRKIKLNKLK